MHGGDGGADKAGGVRCGMVMLMAEATAAAGALLAAGHRSLVAKAARVALKGQDALTDRSPKELES